MACVSRWNETRIRYIHRRNKHIFHGTIEKFNKQKEYDEHKVLICRQNGIRLYDISTQSDADIMVYEIGDLLETLDVNRPKYSYIYSDAANAEWNKNKKEEMRKAKILLGDKNHKQRQEEKRSTNGVCERRLAHYKNLIEQYENGTIVEPEKKYLFWQEIVKNKGAYI